MNNGYVLMGCHAESGRWTAIRRFYDEENAIAALSDIVAYTGEGFVAFHGWAVRPADFAVFNVKEWVDASLRD